MGNRNHVFATDEFYHCYNRGVDKRTTFIDAQDFSYFLKSAEAYNSVETLGKLRLYENLPAREKIVDIVSYCLLPNHFHFVLQEKTEHGISNFMSRVGTGYTMYFNEKYERSGALFQGVFKSKHLESDQDLRQVISYVAYNNIVHHISDQTKYRSGLNQNSDIVRGFTSNNFDISKMQEIVQIIKEQRLSFDS